MTTLNFPTWKTAEGYTMLIRDMTDNHLVNAIGHLQTNAANRRDTVIRSLERQEKLIACPDYISDQGDVGRAMESYLNVLSTLRAVRMMAPRKFMEGQQVYQDLLAEAVYRKLEIPSKWC